MCGCAVAVMGRCVPPWRDRLVAPGRGLPDRGPRPGRRDRRLRGLDANFALIEVFPTWQTGIGLGWIMICFAVTCLLAIAFISKFLPETKNHSVEEVAAIFEQEAQGGQGASGPLTRGTAAT